MHDAAFAWVSELAGVVMDSLDWGLDRRPVGLDVGSGGELGNKTRKLFDPLGWSTVDWNPEREPDVVADMTVLVLPDSLPGQGYDVVLCTEVLEHVPQWRALLFNCVRLVAPGGHLIVTCAGPGREPHSGLDGGPLQPGEYYANVDPHALAEASLAHAIPYGLVWRQFIHNVNDHDIYLHQEVRRARVQG